MFYIFTKITKVSNMRIRILLIASLLLVSYFASGQIVTTDEAKQFAGKVFSQIAINKGIKGDLILEESVIKSKDQEPAIYVFTDKKGGFLILSAEKRTFPLLGWADSGTFSESISEWPPSLKEIVNSWVDQIEYVRERNLESTPEISEMWLKIEKGDLQELSGTKSVLPLLSTRWSQGCGYNALCPADPKGPCGRVYTGCVATAMAQVIRYNQHPVTGVGSSCYTHGLYGEICADFSATTYDYSSMSNTAGNAAVAKLMYHSGVAVTMNYGTSGSSAYSSSVAYAMRNNFDYTNGLIIGKGGYTEETWARILKSELDKSRPLYYSGQGTSGHAFVLDGYQPTNHFHVNWGWGGSSDGYFYLNSLNPGSMNFTSGQQAIVGMIPTSAFTGLNFSAAADLTCKTASAGNLADGTDYVNYYKNTYPVAVGKELVYRFTTTMPGRIRIKITNQAQSVYTFLLNYANKDSLINYGINGLTADNTKPGTYYVVVEGINGQEPAFTIEVICPTAGADLDIPIASVTPRYIQSLQPNIVFNSTVKNIGNTSAPSCIMDYYLSSDSNFDPGSDLFISNCAIPVLNTGQSASVNSVISMPDGLLPGNYYVIFVADRENLVPEADDENRFPVYVTVPEAGLMNCSSAVSLSDRVWYHGNTLTDGSNTIEKYSEQRDFTGPEVIHTFTPLFDGLVNITFVEKSPGMLHAMVIPVCNEKTVETSLRIYNMTDTLVTGQFYAVAGNQYFIVVDGQNGSSGDYSLMAEFPEKCPVIKVQYSGKTDLCDGEPWPGFWTFWGYKNYQWYKDGAAVAGAVNSSYNSSSPGIYHVEVRENGCAGSSVPVNVRMDLRPDTAHIASLGDTIFCQGGSVTLKLLNSVSYPVNWARNGELIKNETDNTISVIETGLYSLHAINGACSITSYNKIAVNVLDHPANIRDTVPLPTDSLEFYYPFTKDIQVTGGSKSSIVGWDYEPVNDRFGNFWQARYLNGESQKMYHSNYRYIPKDFTLALWFKTKTLKGGMIAGFFDNPWGPSTMDAILYMSDNGKLHFWMSNGTVPVELSGSYPYNDDKWHSILIQHKGIMTMQIDEGKESITSASAAAKANFKGYWTFGGPSLPATVSAKPASMFFNGAIDDIMCVNEANGYLNPYMLKQPVMEVSASDPLPVCVPGTISFDIPFSQKGVEYRVRNKTLSSWAPLSAIGTGGLVRIGGADIAIGTNEFMISAKNIASGCEIMLDTVLIIQDLSVCTFAGENSTDESLKVFPMPAKDILYFESSRLIREIKIFDSQGRIVHNSSPMKNNFKIDIHNLPGAIYIYHLKTEDDLIIKGKVIIMQN
jgi:hypothetical protein